MTCEELLKALNEYVDGPIDPGVCRDFERHLAGCNPCQIVVDNIRRTITLCRAGEVYELPPAMGDRLRQTLRKRWKSPPSKQP